MTRPSSLTRRSSSRLVRRAVLLLTGVLFAGASATALAQNAPPPGYAPPPQGYAPPPGYQDPNAPPPGYQNAPPPQGYAPPSQGYAPPPGQPYQPPQAGYYPPPPVVYAPPPSMHDGFYMRLHLGGGFTNMSLSNGGGTISGGSLSIGAALGVTVAPNLIVFGTFFATAMSDPTVNQGGTSFTASGSTVTLGGFGGGVAYYFEPVNVYISGALALTKVSVDNGDGNDSIDATNVGFGFQGMVGKEWWVTRDWGLGVAAEVIAASMKDNTFSDTTWTATAFSILFSATYN